MLALEQSRVHTCDCAPAMQLVTMSVLYAIILPLTSRLYWQERGLIPRVFQELFAQIKTKQEESEVRLLIQLLSSDGVESLLVPLIVICMNPTTQKPCRMVARSTTHAGAACWRYTTKACMIC